MTRTTPRRLRAVAVPLSLGLLLGSAGCTADDPAPADPTTPKSAAQAAPPPVRTVVSVGEVTGRLDKARKRHVKKRVTQVVDRWLDRAYVGGKFPRNDFSRAFVGFTPGAAAEARRDRALMSNKAIGRKVTAVRATNRRLRIDVLAADGRAVGVTARVVLDFRTAGKVSRAERVTGRLYLTWRDGWKVFAYDVSRGLHQTAKQKQKSGKGQRKAAA